MLCRCSYLLLAICFSFSIQAMEIIGPKYIQPGETVILSVPDYQQYEDIQWQTSRFQGDFMPGGEMQHLIQLHLDSLSRDSQILLRAFGLNGWNYDIANSELMVRTDKPALLNATIAGADNLRKGEASYFSLQNLPSDAHVIWQVADENGELREVIVEQNGTQITLLVTDTYSGSSTFKLYAFVTTQGWQYQVDKTLSVGVNQPNPKLTLQLDPNYTALVQGSATVQLENIPSEAEISYLWSVIKQPEGSVVELQGTAFKTVGLVAEDVGASKKATLSIQATITTQTQQAVLEKEFDITIEPNRSPEVSYQLERNELWSTGSALLDITVSEPEQEAYSIVVINPNSQQFLLEKLSDTSYKITAKADHPLQGNFELRVADIHGHERLEYIPISIKALPEIQFEHQSTHYAGSNIPLIAHLAVEAGDIKEIHWQQIAGSSRELLSYVELQSGFESLHLPQQYEFEIAVKLSGNVVVSAVTQIQTVATQVLNDTGDKRHISDQGEWTSNVSSIFLLPRLDAQVGRDVDIDLVKLGNGPDGFDFSFLSSDGTIVPDFSDTARCLQDNATGFVWLIKHAQRHAITQQLPLASSCEVAECSIEQIQLQLNRQQQCGKSDWRLPSPVQLLSVLSLNRNASTLTWLTNDLNAAIPYLRLRTTAVKDQKVYTVNWYGTELSTLWRSEQSELHFLLMAGQ
ncbi:hypothetical protein EXT48_04365 [Pseudoalteromonas sp. CO348]|uniref:hypothetical protein n=1 Tax=Pseudoalteromonas sp. CO348 TaxID=1777271 RepID=UPI0010236D1C|nr:hypothetical protein [Pseudoalteromonas sp. CO348]RZG08325.1 hypothetical protein EXT48_04365 [Pseudoalteromonas sp. CO348]